MTGLSITDQIPVDAAAIVGAGESWAPSATWRRLVDAGLSTLLFDAIGTVQTSSPQRIEDRLADLGVNALPVTAVGARTTSVYRGLAREAAKGRERAAWSLVRVSRQLGGQTSVGVRSTLADVRDGPLALVGALDRDPTAAVVLDETWRETRRSHREELLELLLDAAEVLDVVLVTGHVGREFLRRRHGGQLPARVASECDPCRGERDLEERVTEALETFDLATGDIDRAILEEMAGSETRVVTYDALDAALPVDRSTIRDHVATGEDSLTARELLRRTDRYGDAAVVPGPLFEPVLTAAQDRENRQRALDEYLSTGGQTTSVTPSQQPEPGSGAASTGSDPDGQSVTASAQRASGEASGAETGESAGVATPPKSSHHSRDPSRARERGPGGSDAAPPEDRRAGYSYCHIPGRHLPSRHAAAVGAASIGDVTLVDRPVEGRSDPCEATWSKDEGLSEVVVSAEWKNPMQHMVSVAIALSVDDLLAAIAARSGELTLFGSNSELLRRARCIGWLPEDIESAKEWVDVVREAREDLRTISGPAGNRTEVAPEVLEDLAEQVASDPLTARLRELADADLGGSVRKKRLRSEVLRFAHGLTGVIVSVFDLLGVEYVQEMRIPEASRHLSESGREAVAETLATAASVQSTYGHFSVYRQLHEDRERYRRAAWAPSVDRADPCGELIGSFVVVGDGVEALKSPLEEELEDDEEDVHPEAPELAVPVSVVSTPSRVAVSLAAARVLRELNLRLTPEAEAFLHGLTGGDPYTVAEALFHLGTEQKIARRRLRLDEVRYALSMVDAEWLFPEATSTISATISVLLAAEAPLSQRELADRAGVSTQSTRNNRDTLEAVTTGPVDLIRITDDGWRLALPFDDDEERGPATLPRDLATGRRMAFPVDHEESDVPADVQRLGNALRETRPLLASDPASIGLRDWVADNGLGTYLEDVATEAEDLVEDLGPLPAYVWVDWRPEASPYGVLQGSQSNVQGVSDTVAAVEQESRDIGDIAMGPPLVQRAVQQAVGTD